MAENPFYHRNGELYCEQRAVSEIARAIRPPFYLYGATTLVKRYRSLCRSLAGAPHLICFALKANAQPALLRLLAKEGAGAEVVSGAELALALRVGFPAERIVFSGVGKSREELAAGLAAGIRLILVESEGELEELERLASASGRTARVGIRINPDIDARTHPHITTGLKSSKFGLDVEAARELYRRHREFPHLEFRAVHAHIGSQVTELAPLAENARRLALLAEELRAMGLPLTEVDVGGGLGVAYAEGRVPGFEDYARGILPWFTGGTMTLVLEPGRSLLAPAGALILEVLYKKRVHGRCFVVVNGGMTDLLRPALYDAFHRIVPVIERSGPAETVDVVGAVCESSDVFGRQRALGPIAPGDLLAILDAGAYGFVMSFNYNLRPRPAELLVEGREYRLVRPAETVESLVARELGEGGG